MRRKWRNALRFSALAQCIAAATMPAATTTC
jgi:hypothetical protein